MLTACGEGFATMKTVEYMDAVKRAMGIESDYRLAKNLGVSTQALSGWRAGTRQPDNLMCYRIADVLKIDPARVIADIEFERAARTGKVDEARLWSRYAERATTAVLAVVAVILSGWTGVDPSAGAQAAPVALSAPVSASSDSPLYTLSRLLVRAMARCREFVTALVPRPLHSAAFA